MGKPTGFLDYEREDARAESPKERIKHFNEFHIPLSREEQMYGLRSTILSVRKSIIKWNGIRLSTKQSGTRME